MDESDTFLNLPGVDPLSYREWHGFLDGLYSGIRDKPNEDYEQEKHYWRIGWIVGDAYDRRYR